MTPLDRLAKLVSEMTPGDWKPDIGAAMGSYDEPYDSYFARGPFHHGDRFRAAPKAEADAAGIVALRNAASELIEVARAAHDVAKCWADCEVHPDTPFDRFRKALAALEARLAGERGA